MLIFPLHVKNSEKCSIVSQIPPPSISCSHTHDHTNKFWIKTALWDQDFLSTCKGGCWVLPLPPPMSLPPESQHWPWACGPALLHMKWNAALTAEGLLRVVTHIVSHLLPICLVW